MGKVFGKSFSCYRSMYFVYMLEAVFLGTQRWDSLVFSIVRTGTRKATEFSVTAGAAAIVKESGYGSGCIVLYSKYLRRIRRNRFYYK